MSSSITDKTLHAPHNIDGSKFWAVIIGINDYKTSPLCGCTSDVNMITRYLTDDLHVPENHIQRLLSTNIKECQVPGNQPPTHANIVNAILGLSTNPDIQHGNNIIIYFAGHGTTYRCAEYFRDEDRTAATLGNVDALCPVDHGPQHTASTKTPDTDDAVSSVTSNSLVPDISDWEINTILAEIARNKGDYITFIIDCCHSASITRGSLVRDGVRSITPLPSSSIPDMFGAADEILKHLDGYQSISAANWRPNMDSHVVLAACQEYEHAKEVEGDTGSGFNGVFTRALISTLKLADLNGESMTYYELVKALPHNATQHPVIAGKHKDSRLWHQARFQDYDSNTKAASYEPLAYILGKTENFGPEL